MFSCPVCENYFHWFNCNETFNNQKSIFNSVKVLQIISVVFEVLRQTHLRLPLSEKGVSCGLQAPDPGRLLRVCTVQCPHAWVVFV